MPLCPQVLIFSQMVKMLDLIEEYCEWREYRWALALVSWEGVCGGV